MAELVPAPVPVPPLSIRHLREPGWLYVVAKGCWRVAFGCAMRVGARGLRHADREGGALLAVCHVSHLDPVFVSVMVRRRVSWMARAEFYRKPLWTVFLNRTGAFPVHRQGKALPGIRCALRKLAAGEMVGIFPEGEIMRGKDSVVRGGAIRRGIGLLAARSGCPVVPVVVAGTHRLNRVLPWLPAKMGRLSIMAGPALHAPADGHRRAGREAFANRLEQAFVTLYEDLRREYPGPGSEIP